MQDIINPIDRALLKAELTKEKRLRSTNKSKNEIYIVTAHDSPNVMQEIGASAGRSLSVITGVARDFRWISMSMTRWKTLTAS